MSTVSTLVSAFEEEFSTDPKVIFSASVPASFVAPSVIVTPGDPFLVPKTFGETEERWTVLVVSSMADKAIGIATLRALSFRVARAARSVGAVWESADAPAIPDESNSNNIVLSANQIRFTYPDSEQLPEGDTP